MSANPAADLYLRALPFLDEKWLRADLICSLRHQADTAILWNHLIQDCELVSSAAAPVRNAAGNLSYLGDDGKHYCGVQKLTCLCCPSSYCGPLTACNCNACRTLDSDAAIKKLTSAAQTAAAQHLTSDAIFQSWLWGNCPTPMAKRSSQRTLLLELHDITLQAAGSCLSSLQLRQQLCIYERYFVALVRCSKEQRMRLAQPQHAESEEIAETATEQHLDTTKAQSNLLNNKRRKEDAEADGKHDNPAHTLAQVGTRAALNFSFAFLRRAWRSGEDTELCSELLGEALESLHDLPAASLFNPSEVSELWIEVLERSMKFLRQVALGDPISGRFVAPRRDRNLSLCLLLELCVQKGTLPAMLEAVLLLLTIWAKEKSPNDNRDVPQTVSAQLVPILKRFAQLSSVSQNKQNLSATQSFLRYLTLPDSEKSYVDVKHAAVVLMSFLDRMSTPHMPVQHNLYMQQQQQQQMHKATTTKSNDGTQAAEDAANNCEKVEEKNNSQLQEQRIYALGWSCLNSYQHGFTAQPAVNLTANVLPQYAAPVLNLNFQVEQVAFSEEYVLFLRDNGNLYMWPIAEPQAEPMFMQQYCMKSVAAHCEGKHFLALHQFGMVYSWGNGENGRLGHGDTLPVEQPEIVYGLNHVKSVHCGCSFSAAITCDGALYTWGRGTYGRLGHGTSDDKLEPTKVTALEKYEVIDVALSSGDAHMLCVTNEGLVFAWGDGDFGKLGNDTLNGSQLPVLVETLPRIKRVFAGSQFSLALSQEGKLYTWGKISGGRLGHADYTSNQTSLNKPQLLEVLQSKIIVHVSVGVSHCLALSSTGEIFGWGRNDNQQICPPSISREPILRTPILVTPSAIVAHGCSCGAAQSIIWSQTCIQNVPLRAPFVIELTESTFYLLDQLLNAVCDANDTARQPPNQERECITIACLNLLKLQFHALLNNDINPSTVGLIPRQKLLSSLKTRVLALAGGSQVLKTIQDAAQQTLQVGWSILLPTAAERAQTLTALLPAEAGGSTAGHKFMTDLLVNSLMAEGGLETALMQLINPDLQQQDQSQALPFLQLIRQLLRNISTMTQVQLVRLLLKSGVKVKKSIGKPYYSMNMGKGENSTEKSQSVPSLIATDVPNPSLDLLHRFQRLLLSHLHQSKPEEIGGAEAFLSDYLTVVLKYCTQVMRKAYEVAVRGTEGVTDILHADISDTLLYELIIGLILLKRDRAYMLANYEWNKHFLPLLKALDAFNRLICDSDIQDADDMGWPGIISRGNSQKPAAYDEFMRIVDVQNQVLEGQKLIILNGFVCDINEYQ